MKKEKSIKATHFRPSSPRSVAVRGIGAAHTLYSAISRTETLRDDISGITERAVRGFTLIELLVVVLIIGILAAVAVPQYQKAVAKARVTEAIVALKALSDAEEVYFLANGTYTENLNTLDTSIPPTSNYYTYSCFNNQYSSCIARPTQDGYPALEFVFLNHWSSNKGKHWCQADNMEGILTEKGKQKALDICKTFGPQDTSLSEEHGPYYIIQ